MQKGMYFPILIETLELENKQNNIKCLKSIGLLSNLNQSEKSKNSSNQKQRKQRSDHNHTIPKTSNFFEDIRKKVISIGIKCCGTEKGRWVDFISTKCLLSRSRGNDRDGRRMLDI